MLGNALKYYMKCHFLALADRGWFTHTLLFKLYESCTAYVVALDPPISPQRWFVQKPTLNTAYAEMDT